MVLYFQGKYYKLHSKKSRSKKILRKLRKKRNSVLSEMLI